MLQVETSILQYILPHNWPYKNGITKGASIEARHGSNDITVRNGHTSTVELLPSKGASTEARCNLFRETPLHFAARGGLTGIVELLLGKGASTEV